MSTNRLLIKTVVFCRSMMSFDNTKGIQIVSQEQSAVFTMGSRVILQLQNKNPFPHQPNCNLWYACVFVMGFGISPDPKRVTYGFPIPRWSAHNLNRWMRRSDWVFRLPSVEDTILLSVLCFSLYSTIIKQVCPDVSCSLLCDAKMQLPSGKNKRALW